MPEDRQPRNQARTIDELIALLQIARNAHGGEAPVRMLKDRATIAEPVSLQAGVMYRPPEEGTSSKVDAEVRAGSLCVSGGWNFDLAAESDKLTSGHLEICKRVYGNAQAGVVLF